MTPCPHLSAPTATARCRSPLPSSACGSSGSLRKTPPPTTCPPPSRCTAMSTPTPCTSLSATSSPATRPGA
ncbi:hypothetical protein EJP617_C050 (plasmid) [Erwinia sp. Ejp617]|nr:hypothetical protein EJP617_C050 [Erwinia sp. Ejp617]